MFGDLPTQLTEEEQLRYAQASVSDYRDDQRPFQIVYPTYEAPKFLQTFAKLDVALSTCGLMCRQKGVPFRLVKWGNKAPCMPCRQRISANRLPGYKVVYSQGALEGYPDAMPIADFKPNGERIVYGPLGDQQVVGAPNYIVSAQPYPKISNPAAAPMPLRYQAAVESAQYLTEKTGQTSYLCSSMGADCSRDPKRWFPVVYVDPGGVIARYPYELDLGPGSIPNSTNAVTPVSPFEYRELVAMSNGVNLLGQGA